VLFPRLRVANSICYSLSKANSRRRLEVHLMLQGSVAALFHCSTHTPVPYVGHADVVPCSLVQLLCWHTSFVGNEYLYATTTVVVVAYKYSLPTKVGALCTVWTCICAVCTRWGANAGASSRLFSTLGHVVVFWDH
jgi:hypothetical protein